MAASKQAEGYLMALFHNGALGKTCREEDLAIVRLGEFIEASRFSSPDKSQGSASYSDFFVAVVQKLGTNEHFKFVFYSFKKSTYDGMVKLLGRGRCGLKLLYGRIAEREDQLHVALSGEENTYQLIALDDEVKMTTSFDHLLYLPIKPIVLIKQYRGAKRVSVKGKVIAIKECKDGLFDRKVTIQDSTGEITIVSWDNAKDQDFSNVKHNQLLTVYDGQFKSTFGTINLNGNYKLEVEEYEIVGEHKEVTMILKSQKKVSEYVCKWSGTVVVEDGDGEEEAYTCADSALNGSLVGYLGDEVTIDTVNGEIVAIV